LTHWILLEVADFTAAAHQAVFAAVAGVGLPSPTMSAPAWHSALAEAAPIAIHPMLAELAVAPLPVLLDPMTGRPATRYVDSLVTRVREVALSRQIADALGQLRRLDATPDADADPDRRRALAVRLQDLQRQLAALRDREEA
jgi:DNA primase